VIRQRYGGDFNLSRAKDIFFGFLKRK